MTVKSHITVCLCPHCYHSMYHGASHDILNGNINIGYRFICDYCGRESRVIHIDNDDGNQCLIIEPFDGILSTLKEVKVIHPVWKNASVTRVIDGDTFDAVAEFRFRILGVNAPEMKTGDPGKVSKKWLTDKILGQQIKFRSSDHDVFGRLLTDVVHDHIDIGREMLLNGMAVPYDKRKPSSQE